MRAPTTEECYSDAAHAQLLSSRVQLHGVWLVDDNIRVNDTVMVKLSVRIYVIEQLVYMATIFGIDTCILFLLFACMHRHFHPVSVQSEAASLLLPQSFVLVANSL